MEALEDGELEPYDFLAIIEDYVEEADDFDAFERKIDRCDWKAVGKYLAKVIDENDIDILDLEDELFQTEDYDTCDRCGEYLNGDSECPECGYYN